MPSARLKLAWCSITGAFQAQWVVCRAWLPSVGTSWHLWSSQALCDQKIFLGNLSPVLNETTERQLRSFLAQSFWLVSRGILLHTWMHKTVWWHFSQLHQEGKLKRKCKRSACWLVAYLFSSYQTNLSNQKFWKSHFNLMGWKYGFFNLRSKNTVSYTTFIPIILWIVYP